ncbi:MAG TPA: hypothetical protein ENJ18_13900 [Nannocystis exedens]|nr:hypothetical protein [Nannocystis exedens]
MYIVGVYALLVGLSGCERGFSSRVNYADHPDLAAAKRAFACESSPQGVAAAACAAIAAFEGGAVLKGYPEQGSVLFIGRSYCATDLGDRVVFEIARLASGQSPAPVDAEHRPKGVLMVTMHSFSRKSILDESKTLDEAAEQTTRALAEGTELELELPAAHPFPANYEGWRQLAAEVPGTAHATAESDGISLLDGPGSIGAWWDDFDRSPSLHFVRGLADGGFVRLMPTDSMSAEPRGDSCVTRFYPLPG